MTQPIKCPKREFKPCLGEDCGWWVPLRSADGEPLGRCSILHIAVSLDSAAAAMCSGCDECEVHEQVELH